MVRKEKARVEQKEKVRVEQKCWELVCGEELILGVVLGRRRRRIGRRRLIVVVYAAGLEFVLKKEKQNNLFNSTQNCCYARKRGYHSVIWERIQCTLVCHGWGWGESSSCGLLFLLLRRGCWLSCCCSPKICGTTRELAHQSFPDCFDAI